MPVDPIKNPFPCGEKRELFRLLQYVRAYIHTGDLRIMARSVVQMSGLHLEAVCKLILKSTKRLGEIRFYNIKLGKAIRKIDKMNIYDNWIIESLYDFVVLIINQNMILIMMRIANVCLRLVMQ